MDNTIALRRDINELPIIDREKQQLAALPRHIPTSSSDYLRGGKCG
jgi:hypothetical protein